MSDYIHLIARCTVPLGKAEDARKAIKDLVVLCRENEPDLLMYEFYFNESGTEMHVLETYKNSQAILSHGKHSPAAIDAFLEAVENPTVGFFGPVSDEVMAAYENFNPTAYKHWDGFTR